jgi:hypothetical protein
MSFDLARGFSDTALTPTRAAAMGLLIGGAVVVGLWTYGGLGRWLKPEVATAPACFGAERAGTMPRVEMPKQFRRSVEDRLWNNPRGDHYVERMAAAEFACTAKSCDRKAWAQYRSALFWYVAERARRTRQLVETYGDKGLGRAHELFGGEADLRIERGLRERHKAGVFRIKDFRQQQDAIAILVLVGGKGMRPCGHNGPG